MRLFGVVLFCGALLGVVNADSTTRVGETDFRSRIAQTRLTGDANKLQLRTTYFDSANRGNPDLYTCGNAAFAPSFADGRMAYHFETNITQVDAVFYTFRVATTYSQTSGDVESAETFSGFLHEGRYKMCGCIPTSAAGGVQAVGCEKSFNASLSSSHTSYNIDFGWLHVVDSVALVGPHAMLPSMYSGFQPKVPSVILQASLPDGAGTASVKASWLMNSTNHVAADFDQFMVIDTSSRALMAPALGGWQCGNTHWDGNSSDAKITVLSGPQAVTTMTSTDVSGCTTKVYDGEAGAISENCDTKVLRESAAFTAPEVNSTSYSTGFLCFCDHRNNGKCNEAADFGAALGPIVFRQFYVSNQMKHYTVLSAKDQLIKIAARSDVNFTVADALGLVRQSPSSGSRYSYANANTRACGWSNLDIEPTLALDADTAEYQFSQWDEAQGTLFPTTDRREVPQAVFNLDFAGVHTRRYELCMCQVSFILFDDSPPAFSMDPRLTGMGCPRPAKPISMGSDTSLQTNDNYQNSFFNLFYAQSAGILHVVNLLSLNVNVMLQTETSSHLSVNLMSRKKWAGFRAADHVFYQANHKALTDSRFYITEGECGDAPHKSGSLDLVGTARDMYVRVKDAYHGIEVNGPQSFAKDSIFDDSSPDWDTPSSPVFEWSALWSLTTGWDMDTFKPNGGAGAQGSVGPSQSHTQTAGLALFPEAVSESEELLLTVCFCDQTTEVFPSSTDTCSLRAQANDYSNFKAQVGTVQVAKFVFNNGEPKHYTVFQTTEQSFSMTVPKKGKSTDPDVSQKDKLMIIPAYGDGYGVDNAKPAVKTSGSAYSISDPESSNPIEANKPWKTTYTCGQDHSGTRRSFNFEDDWVVLEAQNPIAIVEASSTSVVTEKVSFGTMLALKYKICYCSSALAGGLSCPGVLTDNSASEGFIDANRYSDFAGYLHVVHQAPADSLPLFTVTHPDYWMTAFNDYGNRSVVVSDFSTVHNDTKVGFLFVENLATLCGAVQARGSGDTLISTIPATNSGNDFGRNSTDNATDILGPTYTDSPRDLQLQICLCDPRSERLNEYVKSVPSGQNVFNTARATCDPSFFHQFGASIGVLSIAEFVVPFGSTRHFTITGQAEPQTFDIVNIVPDAVVTISSDSSQSDHVGFLEMQTGPNSPATTAKSCGTDALDPYRLVAIASKSSTTLTTSAYNYALKFNFVPQRLVKVCYCQVALYNGETCETANAAVWSDLGFLHIVDIAVWPQSFITRSGWTVAEAENIANSFSVKFNTGATGPGTGSAFAISGANTNSDTADVYTYRCGATSEYAGTTPLTSDQYSAIFIATGNYTFGNDEVTVSSLDTSNATIAVNPPTSLLAGQTLGVSNFKWVCMCDTNEIRPSGLPSNNTNVYAGPIETATQWSNFGVTVGKIYFAKTVTLAGKLSGPYYPELRAHFTLSRAISGDQKFTMQGASVVTDKQDLAHSTDKIGFLDATASGRCGIDMPKFNSSITLSTTQPGAFEGTVDATGLVKKVYFQPTQSSKFVICLCRYQVLDSCDDAGSFFETVGWLHIVNLVQQISGGVEVFPRKSHVDVTVSLNFAENLINPTNDRFALIANGGECGQFSSNSAPDGQSGDYTDFDTGSAGGAYEVAAQFNGSTQLLLSNALPLSPNLTQYETATLRFAGKATFSLCYCSFEAEKTCGGQLSSSASDEDLREFYGRFGATLGTVKIMTFLTDTDDEAFTIYRSQTSGGSQIGISKTSTSLVQVDYIKDRWALVSSSDSCGLATAPLVTNGLFTSAEASAAYRYQGAIDACVVPELGIAQPVYDCTPIFTETNQDKFAPDKLAPGKYKLCLCSAGGTASVLGTCNVSSSADFGDQAGYVHVLAGNATDYESQTVMVEANDASATVSFEFDPTQPLSATDRFALVHVSYRCGDALTPAENQVYSSTTFDNVAYTVVGSTLTTGPLGFSSPGAYKVCYCSTANEDTCPDSQTDGLASYGAELGMLIVSDYKFGDVPPGSSRTWSVEQNASATLKLHYPSDFVSCDCLGCTTQISFVPENLPCNTTSLDGATPAVDLTGSGNAVTVNFSGILGSRSFYRACFSTTGGTRMWDFNRLGVYVSDVTFSPTTTQQALAPVTLTYDESLEEGQDSFWFRLSAIPCQGAPSTATSNSTAAHKVPASGVAVSGVDFRLMAPSDDYRLCIGVNCGGTECNRYLDLANTRMSVFSQLTVFPKAVPRADAVNITIVYDETVLAGYSAWFQQSASVCQFPQGPSNSSTDAVPLTQGPIFSFNTSLTLSSQDTYKLCAATAANAPALDFGPTGILILELTVSPQLVSKGHREITLTGTIGIDDQVYFLDTSIACTAVPPTVATATSTQAATITATTCASSNCTSEFDFSLMIGESRLCILPANSDTVVDVDIDADSTISSLQPRITVLDIFLTRTSVMQAVGQLIDITYGSETLNGEGKVWFQRDSCDKDLTTLGSSTNSSSVTSLLPSGKEMSFDFDLTEASQTILNLCFMGETTRSLSSVGVYVTTLTVSPRSVVRKQTKLALLDEVTPVLKDGDKLMFLQSSFSCASTNLPASTFSPSHSVSSHTGGNLVFDLDFASTAVSNIPYRLCLTTSAGAIIDLDVVKLFVIDAIVRPNVVEQKISSVTFSNTDETDFANADSLATGDVVWFVQHGEACGTVPTVETALNTDSVSIIDGQAKYDFNFARTGQDSVNEKPTFFLCVLRGAETRSYESMTVQASLNHLSDALVVRSTTGKNVAAVTVVVRAGNNYLLISDDKVAFVSVTSACDYSQRQNTSAAVDRTGWVAFNSSGVFEPGSLDLSKLSDLSIPLRLCAYSASLDEGLDLSWAQFSILSVSLKATSNPAYKQTNGIVHFTVISGLKTGDSVELKTSCSGSTETSGTVKSVIDGVAQLEINLSAVSKGNYEACLGDKSITGDTPLYVLAHDEWVHRLIRFADDGVALDNATVTLAVANANDFSTSVNETVLDTVRFIESADSCDTDGFTDALVNGVEWNELLTVCANDTDGFFDSYENIGVVASDISIMGSDMTTTVSIGSVSADAGQTVTFKSRKPFDSTSKLFFQTSTAPCGSDGEPRSTSVPMPFLAATADTWSMEFNFTGTESGVAIYRLCVEIAPGSPMLDFNPLGVRVTDIEINSVVDGLDRSNSVQPLAAQQIKLTTGLPLGNGTQVKFVSMDSTECPPGNDGVELSNNKALDFNFSGFAGAAAAKLCYTDNTTTPVEWHMFSSVIIKFDDVTVSPASIPANVGQVVTLTYPGASLAAGDKVLFYHPDATCDQAAFSSNSTLYSSTVTVAQSEEAYTLDFTDMYSYSLQDFDAKLCVLTAGNNTLSLPVAITVSKPVVGIAGDPHVRSASGAWLDFYGEAGVYELLNGGIQANARFGYAVRDNFMIWHPKVMRPGTLVEEVGVQLKDTQTSLRLGIQGGGIVSIRQGLKSTDFWAGTEERAMEIGDYSISWSMCEHSCEVVLPWGTHQRSKTLTIEGRGEFMQMHISKSGGYRFIDVEAIPSSSSTGLLADAASAPAELATHLLSGGEAVYSASVAMLKA